MATVTLLDKVKTALRLSTDAYDDKEVAPMIESAKLDLGIAGVPTTSIDALTEMAIITYCRLTSGALMTMSGLNARMTSRKRSFRARQGTDYDLRRYRDSHRKNV